MHLFFHTPQKGFTLLEVLLVVAILAILAGIVILALNPGKQLADSRNSQRRVDVGTILNAVYQFAIDNNGVLPPGVTRLSQTGVLEKMEICKTGVLAANCNADAMTILSELTTSEKYVTSIPTDPKATTTDGTGYWIVKTANNRVTVEAPLAEQGVTISVTR